MYRTKEIEIVLFLFLVICISSGCKKEIPPPEPYGAVPSKIQINWQKTEVYGLIHFGLNTFTNKQWGYGDVSPDKFNPTDFSADQIVRIAKKGGLKGLILVAKHHDGFCLWPTKTTDYNISNSLWKDGNGDVVKAFEEACRKYNLKFGIYCSPWDRNSAYYGTQKYVKIYRNQLRELYTNYGSLFITWFDGANGGNGYYGGANDTVKVDKTKYYGWDSTWNNIVRKLQPDAVIFSGIGPDVRWVGNEAGHAAETSWETFTPKPKPGKDAYGVGFVNRKNLPTGDRNGKYWMPAEADVPLRKWSWFYNSNQSDDIVKSPEQLFDIYLSSVGRGACLDIGLAPNMEGRMAESDSASLVEFGQMLKNTFATNLAEGGMFKASNVRGNDKGNYGPQNLLNMGLQSYWATDDSITTPELILTLPENETFNIISIGENIKLGQRIGSFAVDAKIDGQWKEIANATSIGYKRLIRLPGYITTKKIRLRVTAAPVCIALSSLGLYATPN